MEDEGETTGGSRLLGWPLLIALGACLVLVLGSALVPVLLPRRDPATLMAIGAGVGLLLWFAVLAAGLRRRQWLVVIAALVILPVAGALAGVGANRIYVARASGDALTFAELTFAPDGTPVLPSGAPDRGPVSAAFHAALGAAEKDRKAYADAMGAFNLGVLNSPYLLQQAPKLLGDCASIASLESLAEANSREQAKREAALIEAVDRSEQTAPVIAGTKMIVASGDADALLANEIETIRAMQAQCELLARRTWNNSGGYFGFSNGGDWNKFRALTARKLRAAEQLGQLQRAAKDRRNAGRELVREELSR